MSLHVATNVLPGVGNGGGGLSVGKTSVALTRKLTTRELSSSPTPMTLTTDSVSPFVRGQKRLFLGLVGYGQHPPLPAFEDPKPAFKKY